MLKQIVQYIKSFKPYINTGINNQIYLVINGQEKKLKRRIKGLTVKFYGNNNTVRLHLPINFRNAVIRFEGDDSTFEMCPTNTVVYDAGFSLEHNAHLFIDCNSQLNRNNVRVIINNHKLGESSRVHIGKNAQISSDILIRTADGHALFNMNEKYPYNKPEDVIIGDNVWIGYHSTILKGTKISNNSVVGACSVVNKKFEKENVIIAGNPAKIVKENIKWDPKPYGTYIDLIDCNLPQNARPMKKVILSKIERKKRKLLLRTFY